MKLFNEFKLSPDIQRAIEKQGFDKPTLIQESSIPEILKGKDVIGESATGSGKTLAFGCGIIEKVIPKQGIQALILTPTRELAEQVKNELRKFDFEKKLNMLAVYGGVSINQQIERLEKTEVVVATPGRLLDHLQRGTINLSKVKILVLDEVDRMLEMGFIEDVEKIISQCPKDRQTLFFSATISEYIQDLARKFMKNPVKVSGKKRVDPKKLRQEYYDIPKNMKMALLVHLLKNEKSGLVMVFCNTRNNTDFVVKSLKANNVKATAIHGGLTQNKRTKTMSMFNKAKVEILVCTDVAARGLDIPDVSHVYNYDLPKDSKDYVHRIGRTARAGEQGKVINILCDYDYENFSRILRDYSEFTIEKKKKPYVERVNIPRRNFRRK
jgi:ATP-dependent RNA helicase DeaD